MAGRRSHGIEMNSFRPRYLVTGAAGFIGSNLCGHLLSSGAQVVGVDNLSSASGLHAGLLGSPRYTFVRADITKSLGQNKWPSEFSNQRIDGIFHLASPASPADYMANQIATLRAGSLGTERVLEMAARTKTRVVLTSTSEVYGDPLVHPQPEEYWGNVNPIGPRSSYDEAKRYAEALCFAYSRERGVDIGVARLFNTYGPGMRTADGRLIPTLIGQALNGRDLTIHGDGRQTRSFCFVSDTVGALILLMNKTSFLGPVNIGNPVEQSVAEVANHVLEAIGGPSTLRFTQRPIDDPERREPIIDRANRHLGWAPQVQFGEGLALTISYMRQLIAAPSALPGGHANWSRRKVRDSL